MSERKLHRRGAPAIVLAAACAGSIVVSGLGAGWAGAASKKSTSTIPAVKNATKLTTQPVVAAGKGKPSSKLEIKNLVVGTGTVVTATSTVSVKYVGALYKGGKIFTAQTWTAGQATTFSLADVVPGFSKGLVGMKVGGRREIVIPPKLGYGSTANASIPATSTLVFVVDMEAVKS